MPFLERNKMIFSKVESTYGTDPVPVEGSDAILTKGVTREIYGGNKVSRDLDYPYMGSDEEINTAPMVTISFDVELAGSSGAGVASQLSSLLRACGLSETIVASTSVTYAPVSTGHESATMYYFLDGERQVITGARGTFTMNMSRGGLPLLSFSFTGLYARPTAVALPDPTYIAVAPQPFNNANTGTFSVHSQAVYGESFSLNIGNEVVHRNLSGFEGVLQIDRAMSANVLFEQVPIATKDFYAVSESHGGTIAKDAVSVVHGTGAGKIITVTMGQTQVANISEQGSDKINMHSLDLRCLPTDAGNDELSIAFT